MVFLFFLIFIFLYGKAVPWGLQDSNLCTHKRTDLQSVSFNHSDKPPVFGCVSFRFAGAVAAGAVKVAWGKRDVLTFGGDGVKTDSKSSVAAVNTKRPQKSQRRGSNPRPADYKSTALPTELRWRSDDRV